MQAPSFESLISELTLYDGYDRARVTLRYGDQCGKSKYAQSHCRGDDGHLDVDVTVLIRVLLYSVAEAVDWWKMDGPWMAVKKFSN